MSKPEPGGPTDGPMTLDELIEVLQGLAGVPSEDGGYSELDHGLQCAAELRRRAPEDLGLQLAGLVHDIGHRYADDAGHGRAGARMVAPLLGPRVGRLVEAHVPAKRYLVATDPAYVTGLSRVSTETLVAQGGAMTRAEIEAFRSAPGWADAVTLRRADDAAKRPGRRVPDLGHWLPLLRAMAEAGGTS